MLIIGYVHKVFYQGSNDINIPCIKRAFLFLVTLCYFGYAWGALNIFIAQFIIFKHSHSLKSRQSFFIELILFVYLLLGIFAPTVKVLNSNANFFLNIRPIGLGGHLSTMT